jgi:hypothetical protein
VTARRLPVAALAAAAAAAACSSPPPSGTECVPGDERCFENRRQVCNDSGDLWVTSSDCSLTSQVCVIGEGCLECVPNQRSCEGLDVVRCRPDGSATDRIATCDADAGDLCAAGSCVNGCEVAAENRSYEGCEYFAVDLDNAVVANQGAAAAQQFSVVLSNASPLTAMVTVEIFCTAADADNPAIQCTEGEPHAIRGPFPVGPGDLSIVDLDAREVDGSTDPSLNDGPGTFRSMHAYRISSTAPLIAYQFNPLENVNVFSNDASLLLPTASLGSRYLALGWPQTLAITDDAMTNGGIHLRAFLTLVGVQDGTDLVVHLSTDIIGGGGIPAMKAGETLLVSLDRFEVVNLETGSFNADFTGTEIIYDGLDPKPFAVFSGSEASDVPYFDSFLQRRCCADHLEQQLFPETAFGQTFVAVKTPSRSVYVKEAGWDVSVIPDEPEWWRILASREDTFVRTNLPPPNDTFTLQRGQVVTFESRRDFLVQASRPISFGQFPGGQQTTGIPSTLPGGERPPGGDPSFILVPPIEQWRDRYLFLVPNKYDFDFLLIAAPASADLLYDGLPLASALPRCEHHPIGFLGEGDERVEYVGIRCPLSAPAPGSSGLQDDGVHTLEARNGDPFGLVVYGWDSFVSYGYPGGTNVQPINVD